MAKKKNKGNPEERLIASRAISTQQAADSLAKAKQEAQEATAALKELDKKHRAAAAAWNKQRGELVKENEKLRGMLTKATPKNSKVEQELKAARERMISFSIRGNDIEIFKKDAKPEYPDSIFSIDRLEAAEIDDTATLKEILSYVKEHHGPGEYILRAWNMAHGWAEFKGQETATI